MKEEVKTTLNPAEVKAKPASKTRFVVFVGLCIAIMAVSAWVVIPFGPIPFTLQIFAVAFAILVLPPKQCMAAVGGYLLLGAIGVPVFSGMRGGIGVLAGPTGGYLWGYLIGAAVALLFLWAAKKLLGDTSKKSHVKGILIDIIAALLYVAVAYVCGWAQYMVVSGVSAEAAFLATVAPFVVVDIVKVVAAAFCTRGVRLAVPER